MNLMIIITDPPYWCGILCCLGTQYISVDIQLETNTLRFSDLFSSVCDLFPSPANCSPLILILCSSLNLLICCPFLVKSSVTNVMVFSMKSLFSMSWGRTSLTVLSHRTPPMRRKHFRSGSTVLRVSITVLLWGKMYRIWYGLRLCLCERKQLTCVL